MRAVSERLTFSNVISVIALFVALGGVGAYAADKLGSKDIAKNAIKSKHIKADAATGADVNESSLGTVPRASRATSAEIADTAEFALDAETLGGFFPGEFQFGNGFDTAVAGGIDNGEAGAYFAFDGDVVIECDETTPTIRWDDFGGDDAVSDVWINGVHETVDDGDSSAETSLGTEDTATVQAWGGGDSVALIHASLSYLPPADDICIVAFNAQENFNSVGAAADSGPDAKDARARAGTSRGLEPR
jgi:hypothetical protein